MRSLKIMHTLLALAVFGMAFAAFAPTAMAQNPAQETPQITVTIDPQSEDLKPLQNSITLNGKVRFVSQGNARTSLTGVSIDLTTLNKPSWATTVISPATVIITTQGEQSAALDKTESFKISITASQDAPAFQEGEVEVQAISKASGAFLSANAKAKQNIKASFFSIIDVVLAESIKVESPQTAVIFPMKITNYGNGATKVSFKVLNDPVNPKLQVVAPNPIQLQSKQAGASSFSQDVNLQVQTPYKNGYMNEPETVILEITSAYALDSKLTGDSNQVSVLITTKGFYVPGPSPILMVGLLGAVAMLVRRFRG